MQVSAPLVSKNMSKTLETHSQQRERQLRLPRVRIHVIDLDPIVTVICTVMTLICSILLGWILAFVTTDLNFTERRFYLRPLPENYESSPPDSISQDILAHTKTGTEHNKNFGVDIDAVDPTWKNLSFYDLFQKSQHHYNMHHKLRLSIVKDIETSLSMEVLREFQISTVILIFQEYKCTIEWRDLDDLFAGTTLIENFHTAKQGWFRYPISQAPENKLLDPCTWEGISCKIMQFKAVAVSSNNANRTNSLVYQNRIVGIKIPSFANLVADLRLYQFPKQLRKLEIYGSGNDITISGFQLHKLPQKLRQIRIESCAIYDSHLDWDYLPTKLKFFKLRYNRITEVSSAKGLNINKTVHSSSFLERARSLAKLTAYGHKPKLQVFEIDTCSNVTNDEKKFDMSIFLPMLRHLAPNLKRFTLKNLNLKGKINMEQLVQSYQRFETNQIKSNHSLTALNITLYKSGLNLTWNSHDHENSFSQLNLTSLQSVRIIVDYPDDNNTVGV